MSSADKSLETVTEEPLNAATPVAALRDPVTPASLVYVRNHFATPEIDPATWQLVVGGAVSQPLTLTLEELKSRPVRSVTMALECAGNGRQAMSPKPPGTPWGYGAISIVRFTGTPLAGILEAAGVARQAVEVLFRGADAGPVADGRHVQFTRSLPLDAALAADPLLAWDLNNEPLTREHGFPVRLVVPGWYGMAAVKWLEQIDVVTEPFAGFFQKEHYVYSEESGVTEGEPVRRIRVRALIASPASGASLEPGPQLIEGIAWSGHGPITRVEVSTDGGANWEEALLEPAPGRYGALRWSHSWSPQRSGSYTLLSRGTDASGNGQPASQRWNRLGYGNNGPQAVTVQIR
jgi:DMSO/TMAO reductase YedYZ molybdopterin-dependent catalytic subunit